MMERRREPRTEADLPVHVWGIDHSGEHFFQPARAREISLSGALLSQLEADLRSDKQRRDVLRTDRQQVRNRIFGRGVEVTNEDEEAAFPESHVGPCLVSASQPRGRALVVAMNGGAIST